MQFPKSDEYLSFRFTERLAELKTHFIEGYTGAESHQSKS